jgi:hypothetical protein
MTAIAGDSSPTGPQAHRETLASAWQAVSGARVTHDLLDWPPDVFALTNVLLRRSEVFRFALSPPAGVRWPPAGAGDWSDAVVDAGRRWCAWVEDRRGSVPGALAEAWSVALERPDLPLEDLAAGRDWRVCEALLTVHAIADEACAGLGSASAGATGRGAAYRGRARELLARTGTLARFPPRLVRVLPKIRTPPTGRASFARYACVEGSGLEANWHKLPARHPGTDPQTAFVHFLLLPWPLRVRESDFRPVEGSVQRLEREPFGLFEFVPSERLDLDLLDRVLTAARDEAGGVDVVVLPESSVDEGEIDEVEAVLNRHGVIYLTAGVRQPSPLQGRPGDNWVHVGVNPRLGKGGEPSEGPGQQWFHIRQNKHHRWSLDESQIYQYHLGGTLHPDVQWWEAIDVPRQSLQFVTLGEEITVVSLVCEDLAENDQVAEVIRAVGPTGVITVLLDGPQLTSRWAARYASVLADDPGSAVLTLTSFGMVQRSRPGDLDPSTVVALWKDSQRGFREIPLEPGAQAVLLTSCGSPATRRTADGRRPVDTGTQIHDVAVHQIHASDGGSGSQSARTVASLPRVLDVDDVTVLTGWAEAVAETLAHGPERIPALLADARPGAAWRSALGIADPSPQLDKAIAFLSAVIEGAAPADGPPSFDAVFAASRQGRVGGQPLDDLVHSALRAALEQRRSRQLRRPTADAAAFGRSAGGR